MHAVSSALETWWGSPLGVALLEQERAAAAAALECVFGFQCLQVGAWGDPASFLAAARTQRQALVHTSLGGGVALACSPGSLAVQSGTVDALLLPHTLEFAAEPHDVLREAERVLSGEGYLMILGFEPLGSWSLRHRLTRGGFPPGLERVLSERRLSDWLKLLGFEVARVQRYLYTWPAARLQAGWPGRITENAGRRLWPRLSGAYLLEARKRVYSVTPVRLRHRMRSAVIGAVPRPTARSGGAARNGT